MSAHFPFTMKILVLLRALSIGGAERRASLIAAGLQRSGHTVTLAVFYGGGPLEPALSEQGIQPVDLKKRGRWDLIGFPLRFIRLVQRERPDIVYSFLSGPNLLTALTLPCLGQPRLVWALCASRVDWDRYEGFRQWIDRLEILLSRIPKAILSNSRAGRDDAVAAGYPVDRIHIVPNGFDTEKFRPDPIRRARLRKLWAVPAGSPLFGLIARPDPMKGHAVFLQAAVLCRHRLPDARFVLIGGTIAPPDNPPALAERLIWLDHHPDMPAVYNALDILVSASLFGEGLSNAIGEAMASGTPCVVTDVGDSAFLVDEYGRVVPPADPAALAEAMVSLWQQSSNDGVNRDGMRRRIVEHFSLAAMINGTEAVFRSLQGS